jgi:AraC-like DNA-binding protein
VYGKTPLAFAAGKRLESARDALLMTDDPIADIAERAGYDSRNAFDRAFVRRFKTTPGKLRAK